MATGSEWPDPETGYEIHSRLSAVDPVASADLAESFLDPLGTWLIRTNRNIDSHLCEQAAEDAILALIKNPHSYQPNRSTLDGYLRMSARGDLLNLLDREKGHQSRLRPLDLVELSADVRNHVWEETDPAVIVELAEEAHQRVDNLQQVAAAAGLTQADARILTLMQQGERKTMKFSRVLGIADLPQDQQRRAVKRAKDRVKQRLKRARGKHGLPD